MPAALRRPGGQDADLEMDLDMKLDMNLDMNLWGAMQ